ncbi:MAG: InlB B-repeat-containing protein, partial [Paludibacteraceae bacterium]|nr:InlB B-repeat-containing protein [Paludibacteraceae bacterium]
MTSGYPFGAFETHETNIVDFYLYAQNYNNYVFEGWYTDAACTTPLTFNGESNTKASAFHYYYTEATSSSAPFKPSLAASSGAATAGTYSTLYAKFRDVFEPEYYNVRAQVISPDGNTGGQVYLSDGDFGDEDYTDDHYDSDYAYQSLRNGTKVYVDLYAQAKDGYEFVGWYADAACTIPLDWNNDYTDTECTYTYYKEDENDVDLPLLFKTSTTSASAPLNTIYAKFRSSGPQTFYAEVRYLADDNTPKRGAYYVVNRTVSEVPITATPLYSNTLSFDSTTTASSVEYGKYPNTLPTYYIVPARGYIKGSWTLTNVVDPTGSPTNNQFNYKFNATSTDAENPTIVTLKHTYGDATLKSINFVSHEGHGSIHVIARNWVDNDAHTGLEWKTVDLGTAVGDDDEDIGFYATDSLVITAIPDEGYQFREWVLGRVNNKEQYSEVTSTNNPYRNKGGGIIQSMKAYYDKLNTFYYSASASASTGGSVQASFANPIPGNATASASGYSDMTIASDTTVTAYFKAVPAAGFEFVRWEEGGTPVAGANAEYSRSFTATSTDSEAPTTLSLHAVFRQESADEAQVIGDVGKVDGEDQGDGVLFSGTFAGAYEFAKAGHTIVLNQNVTLAAPVTISKNITIDFNNFKLSGTTSALVTIPAGKTVIFEDNSAAGFGGIEVTVNTTAEASAVQVNGTLSFMRGVISCENTNTSTTAQIEAIAVKNGATLNMQGGTATANANQIAVGVSVETGGTALLETGAVNATAGTKAYGVLSNAATTTTTWNIAINATVSGSSAEANGLRILNAHGTSATNVVSGGTTTATASAASAKAYAIYVENSPVTISGNMAAEASAVTTTNAYAVYVNGANADVTVETGRFKTNNTQDITKVSGNLTLEGGYYVHENGLAALMAVGVTKGEVPSGTKFHKEGYRFVLSNGDNPNYVVATANGKNFSTLEDAILYANNNAGIGMTILMKVPEYTLPAGTYTIPANATLLLPKDAEQTSPRIIIDRETSSGSKPSPSVYQTLTLASGAHLYVHGNIEVGGRQHTYGTPFTGCPVGPYCSLLSMESGSQITLSNGANLYAWGFVQGQGEIDVRRGGTVHEQFQISDFKGGSVTYSMNGNEYKTFPLMSYFIQNVEVGTTYRPGSHLLTYTGFVSAEVDGIKIIGIEGEAAMFVMKNEDDSEDTWVRKWYDVSTDQQVYEVNNAAHLSQLELNLVASFNSGNYDLPITNNMKIHLLSGEMEISEDVVALPGADIEVNKLSTLVIKAGKRVSMLDSDEWGNYLYNNALGRRIKFRPGGVPTVRDISSAAGIGDAKLNIHGTVDVKGSLYTSAGGATIYSTNADAGTIIFSTAVPITESQVGMVGKVHKLDGDGLIKYGPDYSFITTSPALLTNATGKIPTSGLTAETSYCYIDNAWRSMVVDECTIYDEAPEPDVYYAKPKEFVALASASADGNHLYHSKVGSRTFIMAGDRDGNCQWWEVESVAGHDDLVHCTHPENDVYYYYDTSEDAWMEKRFSVTWQNWDGTEIETYEVRYGSQPKYLGSTPTREKTDYYTYDFAGWTPALTTVTDDATYTAQFSQTDRKYLVVFKKDGAELETQYLHMGEMPVCKTYSLNSNEEWKTAAGLPLSSVTGDVTYILNSRNVSGPFTITFVNWDGNVLQTLANVTSGTTPEYTGTTPVKPALRDENYTFSGWTPAIVAASADAVYTAQYEAQRVLVANDLLIGTNGTEDLEDAVTEKDNLIITSDGISSGQLLGASQLSLKGEAVFKLATTIPARTWYAVAAPWNVDVRTGIYANGSRLMVGRDFDIIEFDAEAYATGENGEKNRNIWKYVEENGGVMMPGKLYMIYLASAQTSLEFHKTTGSILTTELSLTTTGGNGDRANWNAIANPALYHANLGISVIEDNSNDVLQYTNGGYTPATASNMIVGKPIFVQVNNSQSIVIAALAGVAGMPAYRRAPQTATDNRFVVEITRDGQMNDRIIVQTAEEKADEYVIGKDLAKMGVGTKAAQMWMERYNTQLCKNTLEMKGEQVDYPLNLFAPAAGEYILTAAQERGEATLYLTRNDKPVWN